MSAQTADPPDETSQAAGALEVGAVDLTSQGDRVLLQHSERRNRSRAGALPIIGFFLLTPIFIRIFATDATVLGAPLVVVYIFGVWLALIAAAAILAPRITHGRAPARPSSRAPGQTD